MSNQSELNETPSERSAHEISRRDFLGLTAKWSAIVTWVMVLLGMLHLPIPGVFPEKSSRFKIGKPTRYPPGSVTFMPERRVYLFSTERGFHAISAVCTHLGCVVHRASETGEFLCSCHGSKFSSDGGLLVGPAPKGLTWLRMSLSPEGELVIDERKTVDPDTPFAV